MKQYIKYNIHNIVHIYVDERVQQWVIDGIDFQLHFFKTTDKNYNDEDIHKGNYLVVRRYLDFNKEHYGDMHIFHDKYAVPGKVVLNESRRIAIIKDENGYCIFTDSPILITLFVQLLIIREGFSFIHAAAISDDMNNIILLPGAGGVGKTALVGFLVKNHGYRLLGDDIVLVKSDGHCFSFPRPFVLKKYHKDIYPETFALLNLNNKTKSLFKIAIDFIIRNAPFLDFMKKILKKRGLYGRVRHILPIAQDFLATVPIDELFGKDKIASSGIIKKIFFMERYQGDKFKFQNINKRILSSRMFSIIHHEWSDYMKDLFSFGALDIEDIPSYFNNTHSIIEHAIDDASHELFLIPENSGSEEMAEYFLKKIHK